jgi:hypothetical protein
MIKLVGGIKVKWGYKGGGPNLIGFVGDLRRGKERVVSLPIQVHALRKGHPQPGGSLSLEPSHARILGLDFQPLELWENKFLLANHPVYDILLGQT